MVAMTVPQELVLERMDWSPTSEGHDPRCWRRHLPCAEIYIGQLLTLVTMLDSELRRLTTPGEFERRVDLAVRAELAKRAAAGAEKVVQLERRDRRRDAILTAACDWAEAVANLAELVEGYGMNDQMAYMHETPEDVVRAGKEVERLEVALREAVERYVR